MVFIYHKIGGDEMTQQEAIKTFVPGLGEKPHQSSGARDVDENEWLWDKDNMTYKCTKCGFEYSPKGYEDGTVDFPYNYCPHCGIKMKKSGR